MVQWLRRPTPNVGDTGLIPGRASRVTQGQRICLHCRRHSRQEFDPWDGTMPWKGNGNPLQYSCLENPRDRRAWQAPVAGVTKSQTGLKQLSTGKPTFSMLPARPGQTNKT